MRKKKYAFKSAKRSNGNSKKDLERFITQIINLHKQNKTQEGLALTQQALKSFPNDLILLKNTGAFAGRIGAAIKLAKEKAERLAQENALKAAKDIALAKEKALKEKQIQEVNKP